MEEPQNSSTEQNLTVVVSPNPAVSYINADITEIYETSGSVTWSITNSSGVVIIQGTQAISTGSTTQRITVNVSSLSVSQYYFNVNYGNRSGSVMFVKN